MKNSDIDINKAFEANLKYISKTTIDVDSIKNQFVKTDTRNYINVGTVDCPTGKIIVSDPLAYLPAYKFCPILENQIPIGSYPVDVSICKGQEIGIRMCTVRMRIKDSNVLVYKIANPTRESAAFEGKNEVYSGFPVDAGMVSICDAQVGKEYKSFLDEWYRSNPDGNHYDDYFEKYFKESENKYPQYQRSGGDFIEWENPKTLNKLVMVASGFGDGYYQSYWGYDANNEICELIIPLVNPDLFGL